MNFKALTLGAVIGLLVSIAPSCSSPETNLCDATSCANGCCDANDDCIVATTATACGAAGNACVACGAGQQCVNGSCSVVDAGVPDAGGSHPGCFSASGIKLPGTAFTNCGSGGAQCKVCATGEVCKDLDGNTATMGGACSPIPVPDAGTEFYGMPCTQDSECASVGAGAMCRKATVPGGSPYPGGYCTKLCSQTSPCSGNGICAQAPTGGEAESICLDKCSATDTCRTPGYTCYTVGTSGSACWLSPFPTFDAGQAPPNLIGSACTSDQQCDVDGGFTFGFCQTETLPDGGVTGWTNGACLADCSTADVCGSTAICLTVDQTNGIRICFDRCTTGGGGQSNCEANYVCEQYSSGGVPSVDGYCWPNCNNPGAGCPTGQTCSAAGYCN